MVIDLTHDEKQTLFRFLGLYLGSSFILMVALAFFYFQSEQRLIFDLTKSNMQNVASRISSQIIFAHMTDSRFNVDELNAYPKYGISLYDKQKKKIIGDINEKLDFSIINSEDNSFFSNAIKRYKDNYILLDSSTFGHLNVYYVAIKEQSFTGKIEKLKVTILLVFFGIYTIIALIGFYLAKLFLKPISKQRLKTNNFIKDTTHELNTPITALLMCTQTDNMCSERNNERIRLSARRISEIYKDLTYLFLQENEELPKEKLALDKIIQEQIEFLIPFAHKKRLTIETNIQPCEFTMNKEDFIRLCNNLISNAIKYNKMNGTIFITLINRQLIVQDSGIGISKKHQKDIFKRYYRATNQHGGFGIGLNIVKHICNNSNITIALISNQDKGTTFTLTFPNE